MPDKSPFAPSREIDKKAHWLKPTLVAEVRFSEWTHSARSATPCSRTAQGQEGAAGITSEKPVHIKEEQPAMQSALASMKVTNPDRVIDKQSGATKIALIRYYALVADLMIRT
jgi:bifunctional non-homologous end joining protein LigD